MLLASAGAARACHAVLAGEGGASRRVVLKPCLQVALLVILLIHKLVVLQTKAKKNEMGTRGRRQGKSHKKDVTFTAFIFMTMYCVWLDIDCHFLLHSLGQ